MISQPAKQKNIKHNMMRCQAEKIKWLFWVTCQNSHFRFFLPRPQLISSKMSTGKSHRHFDKLSDHKLCDLLVRLSNHSDRCKISAGHFDRLSDHKISDRLVSLSNHSDRNRLSDRLVSLPNHSDRCKISAGRFDT